MDNSFEAFINDEVGVLKIDIENGSEDDNYNWTIESDRHDYDYSGTITYPKYERGLVDVDWVSGGDLPPYWEDVEARIEDVVDEFVHPRKQ